MSDVPRIPQWLAIHRATAGQAFLRVRNPMKRPTRPPGMTAFSIMFFGVPRYFSASKTCSVVVMSSEVACKKVYWTSDILEFPAAPETHERSFRKPVLLEQPHDGLKIKASRQIDRIFIPALECLFLLQIDRVINVLVKVDMLLNVRIFARHVLDRAVTGIGIDCAPASTKVGNLMRKSCGVHCRHPAALAQAEEVHSSAEVVDENINFGEVFIDPEIFHVLGGRFPTGEKNPIEAVRQ